MKYLAYTGYQSGYKAIGNALIKFRLSSPYSHCEILLEPGDGVEAYVPDGTLEPDENNAYWCISSTATDIIPPWSKKRAGKLGGVRLKRITINPEKWEIDPLYHDPEIVMKIFKACEGDVYDYKLILGFLSWPFMLTKQSERKATCSKFCAAALDYREPYRFDPADLTMAVRAANHLYHQRTIILK